ncbi:MAG: bifunctional riboflavin kinase/FAD synthetase [Bacteroidetes bacterium]|nr:bifunctional riboflavin kinase/FAD synthetase [Bacteroidota bacterium]
MRLLHDIEHLKLRKPAVTIGTFDGVHPGHRRIISVLNDTAEKCGGESLLITFHPHPRHILTPETNLKLLNTIEEKTALLEKTGIDNMVVFPFTREFSRLGAYTFVKEYLVNRIGVCCLIFGYDHLFGKDREGSFDNLKKYSKEFGFGVIKVDAFAKDSRNFSSTYIRKLIAEGYVKEAHGYLGYPYPLTGEVRDGYGIGRTIGFPTANLRIWDNKKLLPGNGVYAVRVTVDDSAFTGMLNIGYRPTVNSAAREKSVEVHIVDFEQDIYNKAVRIEFVDRIRDEIRFESRDALAKQLQADKEKAILLTRGG